MMQHPTSMEIQDACKVIRHWNECLLAEADSLRAPPGLIEAVGTLKRYLEREKADGKPIRELAIAEHLLETRQGIHQVMPFVLSAESMEAWKRRKALY